MSVMPHEQRFGGIIFCMVQECILHHPYLKNNQKENNHEVPGQFPPQKKKRLFYFEKRPVFVGESGAYRLTRSSNLVLNMERGVSRTNGFKSINAIFRGTLRFP